MLTPSGQAEIIYDSLFDWQAPLSLWESAESLKKLLGDSLITNRDAGRIEIKKILEAWVMGKSLTMAYHGEPCLVRVTHNPAMDGQIYCDRHMQSVEVTQALYPGRKRNVFGKRYGGFMPFEPLALSEQEAYAAYCEGFVRKAFRQVEERIEHKFQLYKTLDYLLLYVDLFDTQHPRFSYFALQDFAEEHKDDLEARLQLRFRTHWHHKIGHLFLLDDNPTGFVTHFPASLLHAELSLA